jgi:hypothetical protein
MFYKKESEQYGEVQTWTVACHKVEEKMVNNFLVGKEKWERLW